MRTPKTPGARPVPTAAKPIKPTRASAKGPALKPALLAGGNPQIAKADGNAPVRAYLAAMPGWKRGVGRRLDALVARTVPGVRKAVRWNSPFYGVEGQGWFLNFHCFTKYVRVAFFRGRSLRPIPPGESKHKDVRYFDVHEGDPFDAKRLASWIEQAASIPGWDGGSRRGAGSRTQDANTKKSNESQGESASELIAERIAELGDWRGETLARMRKLIQEADPDVVEEWKWDVPVWLHDGIICTGETYKKAVKLTFAKGASLADPKRLFNSSLDGNVRRAIDIHEGDVIDGIAFKALVRAAIALNRAGKSNSSKKAKS